MVAQKKTLGFLHVFVLGFLLGLALAADDSSKLMQITTSKLTNKGIDGTEVIAYGADQDEVIREIHARESIIYGRIRLPVWSDSMGIETAGGVMTTLIPMNAHIPIKKSQIFTTYHDGQSTVSIKVFQGISSSWTKDCEAIGRIDLSGIPPAPRGVPQIEVTFDVDANNTLHVRAEDKATKKSESISITYYTRRFGPAIIAKRNLVTYIDKMRSTINDKDKLADMINSVDKEKIERTLKEALERTKRLAYASVVFVDALKEAEAVCNPVIERVYANIGGSSSGSSNE